jgi:hypothetical protein
MDMSKMCDIVTNKVASGETDTAVTGKTSQQLVDVDGEIQLPAVQN